MELSFKSEKFRKECNDHKTLVRRHGPRRAMLLRQRLDELFAAPTLGVVRSLPGPRCHELRGTRLGQLSVDLDGPYRLIFESANNPMPRKPDGGLDWSKVTRIRILSIEDTHE